MKLIKKILLLLGYIIIISSCENCEDQSEPEALLQFHNTFMEYDKAQGLGSEQFINGPFDHQMFPLSITSDTTTFLFHNQESIDTLSISYKRNFVFESNECGFTVTLSEFKNLEETSFDSIAFEINESTYLQPFELNKNEYFISIYN